jgi:hypothetical protein
LVRSDRGDDTGSSIVEHIAGVDDFEAAVTRWPARIALRQGARGVMKSWTE